MIEKVTSLSEYEAILDDDNIIILDYGETVSDGDLPEEIHWSFTTKNFMKFLGLAMEQQNKVNCSVDVTFSLTKEDYNLGLLGTVVPTIRKNDGFIVYQFVPFLGFFCKTESEAVYDSVYKCVKKWSSLIIGKCLEVSFMSQDHCRASANAAKANWPGVIIADCYPHIYRNMWKNKDKMINSTNFLPKVYEGLKLLHLAANKTVFKLLADSMLQEWRDVDHETDFAEYFEKVG